MTNTVTTTVQQAQIELIEDQGQWYAANPGPVVCGQPEPVTAEDLLEEIDPTFYFKLLGADWFATWVRNGRKGLWRRHTVTEEEQIRWAVNRVRDKARRKKLREANDSGA